MQAAGGVRTGFGGNVRMVPEDAAALRNLPESQFVAESVTTRTQLIYGNQNWQTSVEGTNVDLPAIRSWPLKYALRNPPSRWASQRRCSGRGSRGRPLRLSP